MIVILHPNTKEADPSYIETWKYLNELPDIRLQKHIVEGSEQQLTEIYLIGHTSQVDQQAVKALPAVERVIRISEEYRILGRHNDENRQIGFEYQGLRFDQKNLHIFAGLCAVDNPKNVEIVMSRLKEHGLTCTRMGAYKPRTNPYSFQGHGKSCLPFVFELAGKYGIKVIAMEVTHEKHVEEINEALEAAGNPTGILLQIGTRNTQNFELLKVIGAQKKFPILLKRGFGISLAESLNAAEYLATEGNSNVIFCLRGMKTSFNAPHRNMVDFAHVPVIRRLTRMPVCIDPTHSVGCRDRSPDGILDLFHATAQGIVAGANMLLIEFHPEPQKALVDGPQALLLEELPQLLEDVQIARDAYLKRLEVSKKYRAAN